MAQIELVGSIKINDKIAADVVRRNSAIHALLVDPLAVYTDSPSGFGKGKQLSLISF